MTKPLVIYHADCTDGFAAAFAAWLKLGDEAEYMPMAYGSTSFHHPFDLREKVDDRDVYILDFSFPKPIMEQLFMDASRVVWLDHHKTAFEMWCESERELHCEDDTQPENSRFILLDNNKSGALLAWEYFHPNTETPMLIKHIDDRDRWQFKLEGSKELHAALQSYKPWSFEQWDRLFRVGEPFFVDEECAWLASGVGEHILRAQNQQVESMAKQARKCDISLSMRMHDVMNIFGLGGDASGLACNASLHHSELGVVLATKSGTYGLIWYVAQDNTVKCSLRSNGDYDVSAIAKAFGGGGHKNAAGFQTDIDTLMGWLK